MGRFLDFIFLMVALIMILISTFVSGAVLDPMRDELLEEDINKEYNAQENFDDMIIAATKWVPAGFGVGLVLIVAFREFRRQRSTAIRGPPPQ